MKTYIYPTPNIVVNLLYVSGNFQTGPLYQPREWDGEGDGREEVQEGGDVCTPVADSC